jgi:hypothetical protein
MFNNAPESYNFHNTNDNPQFNGQLNGQDNISNAHTHSLNQLNQIESLTLPVLMHNPHVLQMFQRLIAANDEAIRASKLQSDLLQEQFRLKEEVMTLKSSLHSMRFIFFCHYCIY